MLAKKYALGILFFLLMPAAWAQDKPFLHFSVPAKADAATYAPDGELSEVNQGKSSLVYSAGGYVQIQAGAAYKASPLFLQARAYFRAAGTSSVGLMNKSRMAADKFKTEGNAPVYLAPNREYVIDIIAQGADTLVKQYVLIRPLLIPRLQFFEAARLTAASAGNPARPVAPRSTPALVGNAENTASRPFYTMPAAAETAELELSPNQAFTLSLLPQPPFTHLGIAYTLRNLKTGQEQHGQDIRELAAIPLKARTDYSLHVYYLAQQESGSRLYIHVRPHWYQAPQTYIALLLLLVLLVAAGYRLQKKHLRRSKKEQQKLEQAALRLQSLLNPHFTFNALSSIQGLINTGRTDEANQYLEEFSSLLRKTLSTSQQVFNSLDQELEMMRLYIKLEAFRFKFNWQIDIDENIEAALIDMPTLLLQPVIENAIKHGLTPLGEKGQLHIICKSDAKKGTFVLIVKDNGQWLEGEAEGYGLSLTRQRIAALNQLKKDQSITFHLDKTEGTAAIFTFHHWI